MTLSRWLINWLRYGWLQVRIAHLEVRIWQGNRRIAAIERRIAKMRFTNRP